MTFIIWSGRPEGGRAELTSGFTPSSKNMVPVLDVELWTGRQEDRKPCRNAALTGIHLKADLWTGVVPKHSWNCQSKNLGFTGEQKTRLFSSLQNIFRDRFPKHSQAAEGAQVYHMKVLWSWAVTLIKNVPSVFTFINSQLKYSRCFSAQARGAVIMRECVQKKERKEMLSRSPATHQAA